MRLPLRHPPPDEASARLRCAHLEALAVAAQGLPLGPAASHLVDARGRGRHGNALQWHLGLRAHDSRPEPDWEDRIEIKLVSVWQRADGRLTCDRLRVCEASCDPWRKLSNVLFVFADRLSRVVLGHQFFHLDQERLVALARSYAADPHFDRPELIIESREGVAGIAPAYYLVSGWLERERLLPPGKAGVGYRFDSRWWTEVRRQHRGRDPLLTFARAPEGESTPCPRCRGSLRVDLGEVLAKGVSPAIHTMPLGGECALRGHAVIDAARLPVPRTASDAEQFAGVEARVTSDHLWRLADRVPEPADHEH